jgi:subtilisin family serine protease
VVEKKAFYSNKGPRIDIYAPAVNTIGARNTINDTPITTPAPGITTTTTRPPFRATCTFNPYPTSVNEGASITFGVTVTGVPANERSGMYWGIVFTSGGPGVADDEDFNSTLDSFTIDSSGRGTFTVPIVADLLTEGVETFTVGVYDAFDPLSRPLRPIATTDPITIADTSTGQVPPGYDSRNLNYFKGIFGGTSAACPHVAGIIACALETYPNMTAAQALSYIQTYADHGLLRDRPLNTDYEADQWLNDEHILFNGPNMHVRYQPNIRPNQVHPVIGHQSRPLIGAVYPRFSPNVRRPTPAPLVSTTTPRP